MDNERDKEIYDALVQAKVSLFLSLVSIPFTILGLILLDTSSLAAEILGIAIVALLICPLLAIYWYRTWKRLKNQRSE